MKTLAEAENGGRFRVVSLRGGRGMVVRLNALGIREGVIVTKVSAVPAAGPVTVRVGASTVALGRGVAAKILVEEVREDE